MLTFYYDNQKEERDGLCIGPFYIESQCGTLIRYYNRGYICENEFYVGCCHCREYQEPSWSGHSSEITTVIFDDTFASCNTITSTAFWFDGCVNLTTIIGIGNLNTENVTTMWRMFAGCSSLTNLDISRLRTDKVKFMNSMFAGCSRLISLDLSSLKTSKVISMQSMFDGCSSLTDLDLSGVRTENVTTMCRMFANCSSLTDLDLSGFKTDNLTEIGDMFSDCSGLSILDLDCFNTCNVESACGMFDGCLNLKRIYVGSKWDLSRCWETEQMFEGCTSITGGNGTLYDADQIGTIYGRIDREGAPGYLTDKQDKDMMTAEPYAILSDDYTVLTFYFDDLKSDRKGFGIGPFTYAVDHWGGHSGDITTVIFDDSFANCKTIKSTAWWFNRCKKLTKVIGMENLLTNKVTKMYNMFYGCSSLTSLDLSGLRTDNVTDMSYMFYRCTSLKSLDLSGFMTDKVENMASMFKGCSALESIHVGNGWKASRVTDMFDGCNNLKVYNDTSCEANHTDQE